MYNWNEKHGERNEKVKKITANKQKHASSCIGHEVSI